MGAKQVKIKASSKKPIVHPTGPFIRNGGMRETYVRVFKGGNIATIPEELAYKILPKGSDPLANFHVQAWVDYQAKWFYLGWCPPDTQNSLVARRSNAFSKSYRVHITSIMRSMFIRPKDIEYLAFHAKVVNGTLAVNMSRGIAKPLIGWKPTHGKNGRNKTAS